MNIIIFLPKARRTLRAFEKRKALRFLRIPSSSIRKTACEMSEPCGFHFNARTLSPSPHWRVTTSIGGYPPIGDYLPSNLRLNE